MKILVLWLALGGAAVAADDAGPAWEMEQGLPSDLPPPGPAPASEDVERITYDVASGLRCPVCQGLSVADSPSHTAVAMKDRVRFLVQVGYTPEQIDAYFVARYGEWVLLAPPASGLTWILWLAPVVLLGVGVLTAASMTVRRAPPAPTTPPKDAKGPPAAPTKDAWEQRLLSELEDDGS